MSSIKVVYRHSAEWLRQQRIARGEELPWYREVLLDLAAAPISTREKLCGNDGYPERFSGFSATSSGSVQRWTGSSSSADAMPELNSLEPTPSEVCAAIENRYQVVMDEIAEIKRLAQERQARAQLAEERLAIADELYGDELKRLRAIEQLWDAVPADAQACARKRVTD